MPGFIYFFSTFGDRTVFKAGRTDQESLAARFRSYLGPSKPRMIIASREVDDTVAAEGMMLRLLRSSRALQVRPDLGTEWFSADTKDAEEVHATVRFVFDVVEKAVRYAPAEEAHAKKRARNEECRGAALCAAHKAALRASKDIPCIPRLQSLVEMGAVPAADPLAIVPPAAAAATADADASSAAAAIITSAIRPFIRRPKQGGGGQDMRTANRDPITGRLGKGSEAKPAPDFTLLSETPESEHWRCDNCLGEIDTDRTKRHVAFSTHRDRKCLHVASFSRDVRRHLHSLHGDIPFERFCRGVTSDAAIAAAASPVASCVIIAAAVAKAADQAADDAAAVSPPPGQLVVVEDAENEVVDASGTSQDEGRLDDDESEDHGRLDDDDSDEIETASGARHRPCADAEDDSRQVADADTLPAMGSYFEALDKYVDNAPIAVLRAGMPRIVAEFEADRSCPVFADYLLWSRDARIRVAKNRFPHLDGPM